MTISSFLSASACLVLAAGAASAAGTNSSSSSSSSGGSSSGGSSSGLVLLADIAPTLKLDAAAGVTVSGLSSGGYMAVQMHVAFRWAH